jgi:hypothetical protein
MTLPVVIPSDSFIAGIGVGEEAAARLRAFREILTDPANQSLPEERKLQLVNDFVNGLPPCVLREPGHWPTPIEVVAGLDGGYEGPALCKFMMLRALGVPDDRLLVALAAHDPSGARHALAVVMSGAQRQPLLLTDEVRPAQGTGYIPIFTLNGGALRLPRDGWDSEPVAPSDRASAFRSFAERLQVQLRAM